MPTALHASMRSVPAGAVTFFPSTVMVTSGINVLALAVSGCARAKCRSVSDFFNLQSMAFRMLRHNDNHLVSGDHACYGVWMRHFRCPQVFRAGRYKRNDLVTSFCEMSGGLREIGEASCRPTAFRSFHLSRPVGRTG